MKYRFIIPVLIIFFSFQPVPAAEIDSITPRNIALTNSRGKLNALFNKRLQEGIAAANAKRGKIEKLDADEFCDEELLYRELRKAIFQSLTASWGLKGYNLDKQLRELLSAQSYSLSLNNSIYRDIDFLEGFSLNIKELSDVVNVDGHLIGLDKIGHFFAEGWQYFEMSSIDGSSLEETLDWGKDREEGIFGYTTTGIFSFGDLVANFNGLRFWNRILLRQPDPLSRGIFQKLFTRPYVTCNIQIIDSLRYMKIIRSWSPSRRFDISQYLDGSWDEGNNCNSYADPSIEQKVADRIQEVNPGFKCPMSTEDCIQAREKYGIYSKYLLHPSCLAAR